jgi:hypothetical protein
MRLAMRFVIVVMVVPALPPFPHTLYPPNLRTLNMVTLRRNDGTSPFR